MVACAERLITTQAHHLSDMAVQTHTKHTRVAGSHTHTHKLLHTSCTAAAEKEAEERIWVGKAMLSDC